MATKIETLKKPNGDQVLPRTRAKAVSMEDGATVEAAIGDITEQLDRLDASKYMTSANPIGTGSFSLNRANGTDIGDYSFAEGYNTAASGESSHAEGYNTSASADYSHAEGLGTITRDVMSGQHVQGWYNSIDDIDCVDIVGNGFDDSSRSNAYTLTWEGDAYYAGAVQSNGADYAELFEWVDGNTKNEDRRGHFVTLDEEKIRFATSDDEYILGVVSSVPAILGDRDDCWRGRWLTDVFGERVKEEKVSEDGRVIMWWKTNPDYDATKQYIPREKRPEWAKVGMLGKLVVVDDGTCVVGGYVKPSANGIGTASDSGYRVMQRMDENHIRVLIK